MSSPPAPTAVDAAVGKPLAVRVLVLMIGLALYGSSLGLLVDAGLGMNPWGVLQVAIARRAGIGVGDAINLVSVVVLLAWIPIRQRPGVGTLMNCLLVGVTCTCAMHVLVVPTHLANRLVFMVLGIALNGVSSGIYVGAGLGAGPRDGLSVGVHRVTGWKIRTVRISIELAVLATGWCAGGPVGPATPLYAVGVGVAFPWALHRVRTLLGAPVQRSRHHLMRR